MRIKIFRIKSRCWFKYNQLDDCARKNVQMSPINRFFSFLYDSLSSEITEENSKILEMITSRKYLSRIIVEEISSEILASVISELTRHKENIYFT